MIMKFEETGNLCVLPGKGRKSVGTETAEEVATAVIERASSSLFTSAKKLTVWCALWAGGIIGPYFFKNDEGHNVTVNGDWYRAMITNFFIPELNNHDVQELWFQQDGATSHTAPCHNRFIERHVWLPPNFTFWTCELASKIL
ncbi:putative DD41D transposase [Trichonephila clavipes]|nr:putative DD41D transposase [Trichonephila clavipes]